MDIRIYLGEAFVQTADEMVNPESNLSRVRIKTQRVGAEGFLYWANRKTRPPAWLEFLEGVVADEITIDTGVARHALLILQRGGRFFAIAFGLGHGAIVHEKCVSDFGIKVTLNRLNPARIKTIDSRSFGQNPLHTVRQLAYKGPLDQFGFSYFDDFLRRIEAEPDDRALAELLSGSEALLMKRELRAEQVAALLDDLLRAYGETRYKEILPIIDRIRTVKDPTIRQQLDDLLVAAMNKEEGSGDGGAETQGFRVTIAPPSVTEFDGVTGFRYAGHRVKSGDLDLEPTIQGYTAFRRLHGDAADVLDLKRDRLELVDEAGQIKASWTIYQSIYFEARIGDRSFLISDAKWFEIDPKFARDLSKSLKELRCSDRLPDAARHEHEGAYNLRASTTLNWALMDRDLVSIPSQKGPIEICDLFNVKRDLVHVKSYRGSQSTSHLFAQGVVSATALVAAPVRTAFANKLTKKGRPNEAHAARSSTNTADHCVVYALIVPRQFHLPEDLPVFAKLNLSAQISHLKGMGYKVCLMKIVRGQ